MEGTRVTTGTHDTVNIDHKDLTVLCGDHIHGQGLHLSAGKGLPKHVGGLYRGHDTAIAVVVGTGDPHLPRRDDARMG